MNSKEIEELKAIRDQAAKNLDEYKAFVESANGTIAAQAEIITNLTNKVAELEAACASYNTPEDVGALIVDINSILKQADDIVTDPAPVEPVEPVEPSN